MQLVVPNTQILALVKCSFSLSHGDSYPARGFSITKILLDAHGTTIDNDTIIALRFVKDHLQKIDGARNFKFTTNLIESCENAHSKYLVAEEKKKMQQEKETKPQQVEMEEKEKAKNRDSRLQSIESMLKTCKLNMKVAEDSIQEGNAQLKETIGAGKKLNLDNITIAQS